MFGPDTNPLVPIALDLDGSLAAQPELRERLVGVVELNQFAQSFRLRASRTIGSALCARLDSFRRTTRGPWLTFIGSGDFHHTSLALLGQLDALDEPFTLVLIDHHPDWFTLPPKFHCGNWVAGALRLPSLEHAVLLAQDSTDLRWQDLYAAPLREIASGRVTLIPWRTRRVRVPLRWLGPVTPDHRVTREWWGSTLTFAGIDGGTIADACARIAGELAGQPVYLSIDKDCLRRADAACDWEQGNVALDDLVAGITLLRDKCRLIGADVCGERARLALKGLVKRIDAGRVNERWIAPNSDDDRLNQAANLRILEALVPNQFPTTGGNRSSVVNTKRSRESHAWTAPHG